MSKLDALMNIKDSLDKAVELSGGSNIAFSFEELTKMSALDLLKFLGPNHIVFKYENPEIEKCKEFLYDNRYFNSIEQLNHYINELVYYA